MIQGRVNDKWEPLVIIGLVDADGNEVPTSVLVDSGFDGDLTLPRTLIERLQLDLMGDAAATMADDRTITAPAYAGVAVWDGAARPIVVLQGGATPLAGMKLWNGCRLTIEAWPQGTVTIEEAAE